MESNNNQEELIRNLESTISNYERHFGGGATGKRRPC